MENYGRGYTSFSTIQYEIVEYGRGYTSLSFFFQNKPSNHLDLSVRI